MHVFLLAFLALVMENLLYKRDFQGKEAGLLRRVIGWEGQEAEKTVEVRILRKENRIGPMMTSLHISWMLSPLPRTFPNFYLYIPGLKWE